MFLVIILAVMIAGSMAGPQFLAQPTFQSTYAHPAVLINSAMEEQLPSYLRNDFYKNPRIAAGLARESWFLNKEMQVIDRETDKIPREKIYNVLHNAGFARRR